MAFLLNLGVNLAKDAFTAVSTVATATVTGLGEGRIIGVGEAIQGGLKGAVSRHIDQTIVKFDKVVISELHSKGFKLDLEISLTETGNMPARITFPKLDVMWDGHKIATLKGLKEVSTTHYGTGYMETSGQLTIEDKFNRFPTFLQHVLEDESFDWTIGCPNLGVVALGMTVLTFDTIAFEKTITVQAFHNLKDITVHEFGLRGDVVHGKPCINLVAKAKVVSKSDLSISVGKVSFKFSLGGSVIGTLSTDNLDLRARDRTPDPKKVAPPLTFSGNIFETTPEVGILMSKYLNGTDQNLTIHDGSVESGFTWLSPALVNASLNINLVGKKTDVITSIELSNIAISTVKDHSEYLCSGRIKIGYKNPFDFPFEVKKASASVNLRYKDKDAATFTLKQKDVIPNSSVVNGRSGQVQIMFDAERLEVKEKDTFKAWRRDVNVSPTTVKLSGLANVVVETDIGGVTLTKLAFSGLSSRLTGIKWL